MIEDFPIHWSEEIVEEICSRKPGGMDESQIKGILLLREYLKENVRLDVDSIQNKIFFIAKDDLDLPPRKLFESIYQIILGKKVDHD